MTEFKIGDEAGMALLKSLETLVEVHGYASYVRDEEKEAEPDIVAARAAIALARKTEQEPRPIGEITYVAPEALMLLERGRWAEGLPSTLALVVAMLAAVAGLLATITYAIWRM